jgi:hypothetical protein
LNSAQPTKQIKSQSFPQGCNTTIIIKDEVKGNPAALRYQSQQSNFIQPEEPSICFSFVVLALTSLLCRLHPMGAKDTCTSDNPNFVQALSN